MEMGFKLISNIIRIHLNKTNPERQEKKHLKQTVMNYLEYQYFPLNYEIINN